MRKLLFGFIIGIVLMLMYCGILWYLFDKSSLFGPESEEVKEMRERIHDIKTCIMKKISK